MYGINYQLIVYMLVASMEMLTYIVRILNCRS